MNDDIIDLSGEESLEDYFCQKGEFTNVTYYMTTLSLDEAADGLNYENEILTDGSFAERMQRDINEKRAKEEIYEGYLKHKGTRFFNSLVVTFIPEITDDSGFLIEKPLGKDFVKLSIKKSVKKLVLDGQHRLYALRELRNDILSKKVNDPELKKIKVPVVFVSFSNLNSNLADNIPIRQDIISETRNIFISLNKTAKKIDKYTALITDDSDLSAVSARRLLETGKIDETFVKWAIPNHALSQYDPYFTTLNFLNDCFDVCESNFNTSIDDEKKSLSNEEKEVLINEKYFDFVEELGFIPSKLIEDFFIMNNFFNEWKTLLSTIQLPKQPSLPELSKEDRILIKSIRSKNILATIAGQKSLFLAIVNSYNSIGEDTEEKNKNIFSRINELYEKNFFDRESKIWKLILVRNDKNRSMIFKISNILVAQKLISFVMLKKEKECRAFCNSIVDEIGIDNKFSLIEEYLK